MEVKKIDIKKIVYERNKGLLRSVVMGKSPMTKIVKTINTEIKKGKIKVDDVENMLDEIYSESVKSFEKTETFLTLFQDRNNRYSELKDELNKTVFATP